MQATKALKATQLWSTACSDPRRVTDDQVWQFVRDVLQAGAKLSDQQQSEGSDGGSVPSSMDDVVAVALCIRRLAPVDFSRPLFTRLLVAADSISPGALARALPDLVQHGDWADLKDLAVMNHEFRSLSATAATTTTTPTTTAAGADAGASEVAPEAAPGAASEAASARADSLHDAIVACFSAQLVRDEAAVVDAAVRVSECAMSAPRMRSRADRVCHLAHDIARHMYDFETLAAEFLAKRQAEGASVGEGIDPLQVRED